MRFCGESVEGIGRGRIGSGLSPHPPAPTSHKPTTTPRTTDLALMGSFSIVPIFVAANPCHAMGFAGGLGFPFELSSRANEVGKEYAGRGGLSRSRS